MQEGGQKLKESVMDWSCIEQINQKGENESCAIEDRWSIQGLDLKDIGQAFLSFDVFSEIP